MPDDRPLFEIESPGYDVLLRTLWNDLELTDSPGAAIAIRGASGQGKSTPLRCLGGLQRPARGVVRVLGTDVHGFSANQRRLLRRDVVGFVRQDHAIVPEWSVARNLAVVRPRGTTRKDLDSRIVGALEIVGLGGRCNVRAGLLSGGEQQRVAVARVLASAQ
jgi:ABC-type lipoprotein export system ATPase subunit